MRIFSKFRDYYDCIVGTTGFDDTIVYSRQQKQEPFQTSKSIKLEDVFYRKTTSVYLSAKIIFVCGKEYHVILNKHPITNKIMVPHNYIELLENLRICGNGDIVARIEADVKRFKKNSFWTNYSISYSTFFDTPIFTEKEIEELHIKYNSPVLTIGSKNIRSSELVIEVDSKLEKFEFVRIMQPWAMFQEIEMYLGGVLCNREDGNVTISDKDLILQHGYNKESFRKLPTPKGKKKRPKEL